MTDLGTAAHCVTIERGWKEINTVEDYEKRIKPSKPWRNRRHPRHAASFLRLANFNSKNLLKKIIYIKIDVIKIICHYI